LRRSAAIVARFLGKSALRRPPNGSGNGVRLPLSCRRKWTESQPKVADQDIRTVAQNTRDAVDTFNALQADGEKVAGVFHLTC